MCGYSRINRLDFKPVDGYSTRMRFLWSKVCTKLRAMEIDHEKLEKLETRARHMHLIMRDCDSRWREARANYNKQRAVFESQTKSFCGPNARKEIEANWIKSDPAIVSNNWLHRMRGLDEMKNEVSKLAAEHEQAKNAWRRVADPLPALREFAERHGRRPDKTLISVSNAEGDRSLLSAWRGA